MPVLAKKANNKLFEIAPEGLISAKLIDVVDLGQVATQYGPKDKVRFVFETDLLDAEGLPIKVFETLGNTLHAKGRLAPRIKQITGVQPAEDADFDLSQLIGTRVNLLISHSTVEDRVYANIDAIVRPMTPAEQASQERVDRALKAAKKKS